MPTIIMALRSCACSSSTVGSNRPWGSQPSNPFARILPPRRQRLLWLHPLPDLCRELRRNLGQPGAQAAQLLMVRIAQVVRLLDVRQLVDDDAVQLVRQPPVEASQVDDHDAIFATRRDHVPLLV